MDKEMKTERKYKKRIDGREERGGGGEDEDGDEEEEDEASRKI